MASRTSERRGHLHTFSRALACSNGVISERQRSGESLAKEIPGHSRCSPCELENGEQNLPPAHPIGCRTRVGAESVLHRDRLLGFFLPNTATPRFQTLNGGRYARGACALRRHSNGTTALAVGCSAISKLSGESAKAERSKLRDVSGRSNLLGRVGRATRKETRRNYTPIGGLIRPENCMGERVSRTYADSKLSRIYYRLSSSNIRPHGGEERKDIGEMRSSFETGESFTKNFGSNRRNDELYGTCRTPCPDRGSAGMAMCRPTKELDCYKGITRKGGEGPAVSDPTGSASEIDKAVDSNTCRSRICRCFPYGFRRSSMGMQPARHNWLMEQRGEGDLYDRQGDKSSTQGPRTRSDALARALWSRMAATDRRNSRYRICSAGDRLISSPEVGSGPRVRSSGIGERHIMGARVGAIRGTASRCTITNSRQTWLGASPRSLRRVMPDMEHISLRRPVCHRRKLQDEEVLLPVVSDGVAGDRFHALCLDRSGVLRMPPSTHGSGCRKENIQRKGRITGNPGGCIKSKSKFRHSQKESYEIRRTRMGSRLDDNPARSFLPTRKIDRSLLQRIIGQPVRTRGEHRRKTVGKKGATSSNNLEALERPFFVEGSHEKSTVSHYHAMAERYRQWCVANQLPHLPTTLEALVNYLEEKGPQVSHAGLLSALRWKHRIEGVKFPDDHNGLLAALARRGRRLGPKNPIAEALHPREVREWLTLQKRNWSQPWLHMIMCLLTLGLRMGLRPGEVEKLSVGDIKVHEGALAVTIRDGKSDHLERVSPITFIEPSQRNGECCPYRWTSLWLRDRGKASPEEPVFTNDGSRAGTRLARESVGQVLQAIGRCVDGENHQWVYSGKSLRRGMATVMSAAGLSTQQIMAMGRWRTHDMPARYTAEWAPALAGASTLLDATAEDGLVAFQSIRRSSPQQALSRLCASGVHSQRHLIDLYQLVRQSRVQKRSFLQTGKNNFLPRH